MTRRRSLNFGIFLALFAVEPAKAFVVIPSLPFQTTEKTSMKRRSSVLFMSEKDKGGGGGGEPIFYNDFEGFDDSSNTNSKKAKEGDDDDKEEELLMIDADSLGDWRTFRRNLTTQQQSSAGNKKSSSSSSKQNEQLLESQNEKLAKEYKQEVWAHETSTPEVGGLVVRMPLEVELRRNYKHSLMGKKFRHKLRNSSSSGRNTKKSIRKDNDNDNNDTDDPYYEAPPPSVWYDAAQQFIQDEMMEIADRAASDGQLDASVLNDASAEVLQLFLDHQEHWQQVCLVLENNKKKNKNTVDNNNSATTVVLNRPMALQLTENLARLVLFGGKRSRNNVGIVEKASSSSSSSSTSFGGVQSRPATETVRVSDFMRAFGSECGVYVGGPDDQHLPATLVHGVPGLLGAKEIAPGIYTGGLAAAVAGVLGGKYKPLEFRFFVGRQYYPSSRLDLAIVLGKYQAVACARSLALKQCIQLPKPLWHEVLETCGGELADISRLELMKRDDLRFQIVDEDDDDDDDDEYDVVVDLSDTDIDELDELYSTDEDDDEDEYYTI